MAVTVQQITDQLKVRLRDPIGFAFQNQSEQFTFIDNIQRILNYHYGLVLTTATFTPSIRRTMYRNSEVAADVGSIMTVRQDKRNLIETPWHSLVHNDAQWYRKTATRYELFSRIGDDLFVIYPAMELPVPVTVVYSTVPTNVALFTDTLVIPDEYAKLLVDMIDMLFKIRGRYFAEAQELAKQIPNFITNEGTESIEAQGQP